MDSLLRRLQYYRQNEMCRLKRQNAMEDGGDQDVEITSNWGSPK